MPVVCPGETGGTVAGVQGAGHIPVTQIGSELFADTQQIEEALLPRLAHIEQTLAQLARRHPADNIARRRGGSIKPPATLTCFQCGQQGHKAEACPSNTGRSRRGGRGRGRTYGRGEASEDQISEQGEE